MLDIDLVYNKSKVRFTNDIPAGEGLSPQKIGQNFEVHARPHRLDQIVKTIDLAIPYVRKT